MFEKEYDLDSLQKIIPAGNNFEMYIAPRYSEHYLNNSYEPITTRLIASQISENGIFVDIGAHFGYFSLLAGKSSKAKRILAFEPTPNTFEILQRNVKLNNFQNIELFNLAISDKNGDEAFTVAEASDSCGFYEPVGCEIKEKISVKTETLDSALADVKDEDVVIKIDAEGNEINILDGMRKTIANSFPKIKLVVEYNPSMLEKSGRAPGQLVAWLFDSGFQVFIINEKTGLIRKIDPSQISGHYEELEEISQPGDYVNLFCVPMQQALNIVFFSHSSELAGAEKSLISMAAELVQRGAVCTVVLPSDHRSKQLLENVGANTIVFPYDWWASPVQINRHIQKELLANNFRKLYENLLPQIKQINPDVIVTNTIVVPWGAILAFLLNKPHLWYIHEFGGADHGLQFFYPNQLIAKYISGSSNVVIANSMATKEYFFGKSEQEKIKVIAETVSIDDSAYSTAGEVHYFSKDDTIKLAVIGTMHSGKGQLDALYAINELNKSGKKVELVLAGYANPEYYEILREVIQQNNLQSTIRIYDFLEKPYALFKQMDILLMCSRNEAFGRVTLEAMMLGKPVIGTRSGGTQELISDGETGLLYSPGDYRDLAAKIKILIDDPQLRVQLGRRAVAYAQSRYSMKEAMSEFYKTLQSVKFEQNFSSREFIDWIISVFEDYQDSLIKDFSSISSKLEQQINEFKEKESREVADTQQRSRETDGLQAQIAKDLENLKTQYSRELETLQDQLAQGNDYIEQIQKDLIALKEHANQREQILQNLNSTLLEIYSSTAWKIIQKMWKFRLWVAPKNSRREKLGRWLFSIAKTKVSTRTVDAPVAKIEPYLRKPLAEQHWVVMATQHTLFIAYLIAERIKAHGCGVRITTIEQSDFSSDYYIVICPQMFHSLPPGEKRISFQMEQSISSRWFSEEYIKTLNESLAVLDYSLNNIEFLNSKGIGFPQVYYLPIGASINYGQQISAAEKKYDLLFYGDEKSSPRRLKMLDALRKEFNLKVVSEVFGSELLHQIQQARFVINIHYYENALLEMPRIQECLSLGVPVISESAQDQDDYPELAGAVRFFEQGSIQSMLDTVRQSLNDGIPGEQIILSSKQSEQRFAFMFDRFLLGMGFLPPTQASEIQIPSINSKMVLSLPETISRRRIFEQLHLKDFAIFDGMRKSPGWVGCALSYAALARKALEEGFTRLMVMEDDVLLPDDFQEKLQIINEYLDLHKGEWDIFVGVLASLHPDASVLKVENYKGMEFVTLDKMTSMVCNIYSENALRLMADWNPENTDVVTNTIDRYFENRENIRVVLVSPYIVGHREDMTSTIWGFQNSQYNEMITKSQNELMAKIINSQLEGASR